MHRATLRERIVRQLPLYLFGMIAATPAYAETVRLRCAEKSGSDFAFTVDVDFDSQSVFIVFDDGTPSQTARADITERFIVWSHKRDFTVSERLDRATGKLAWSPGHGEWLSGGECRRLEKPVL